jgi:ubiquinone/menaquinone biosynthesis C-methylase UbiE
MKTLDVGGAKNTYKYATHIIDVRDKPPELKQEYLQMDVCSGKWDYADKEFDFVYCSNLLEDVRDPVFVCKEMMRVGKKGLIIVPTIITECRIGMDKTWYGHEKYAGFCHHRWLCFFKDNKLTFMQKSPMTHIFDWTKDIPQKEKDKRIFQFFEWKDSFQTEEIFRYDWTRYMPSSWTPSKSTP